MNDIAMSGKEKRIKISNDRTKICKYILGDLVIVTFDKYGKHTFIGEIEEIAENMHDLDGIWISVLPVKEYNSDEIAKRMIREKIRCMVPLRDISDLPN